MKKQIILFPFTFAVLPVLTLWEDLFYWVHSSQVIRSVLLLLAATAVLMVLFHFFFKSWEKAGLLFSIILLFFSFHGRVYYGILELKGVLPHPTGVDAVRDQFLVRVHLGLILLWIFLTFIGLVNLRRTKRNLKPLVSFLNIVSVAVLLVPIILIFVDDCRVKQRIPENELFGSASVDPVPRTEAEVPPDIYYIILDAYGREDILDEYFGYDNSQFIRFLESKGFFIASQSRSNYVQTLPSLAGSLNMSYVVDIPDDGIPSRVCESLFVHTIHDSRVRQILEENGYQIVSFSTGVEFTEIRDADFYFRNGGFAPNHFESLLITQSALLSVVDLSSIFNWPIEYPGYTAHIDRTNYILQKMSDLEDIPGPKFVFVHLLLPHPPFVFESNGDVIRQRYPYGVWDASDYPQAREVYIEGYSNQLDYVNRAMQKFVEQAISNASPQPIIILQGDHGPRSTLSWWHPDSESVREATGILNAYYFPGVDASGLYEGISPINSFRALFNAYFNADYPLLEDRSYYSGNACASALKLITFEEP
jgi:hypothetical protein